ncbi:MAG: hypothetical protein ACK5P5_08970 [Pseudobdellovibrionaceae bacterium]
MKNNQGNRESLNMKNHLSLFLSFLFFHSLLLVPSVLAQDKKAVSSFITTKPNLNLTSLSSKVLPTCGKANFGSYQTVQLIITFSCSPENLRKVSNPLAPGSMINMRIKYGLNAGGTEVRFTIPANVTNESYGGLVDASGKLLGTFEQPTNISGILPSMIGRHRNSVTVFVPNVKVPPRNTLGDVDRTESLDLIERIDADQVLDPSNVGGRYIGLDGPLQTAIKKEVSPDICTQTMNVSFKGAARPDQGPWYLTGDLGGYCGGWYSPLMVFFDDERPKFKGVTDFKLHSYEKKFYWVEKNAPGYFVVLDRNNNGKIDDGSELFGDGAESPNGFEALATFDDNKDKVIDRKDSVFGKLQLWRDVNSNGISEKNELFSLENKNVLSIQTSYLAQRLDFGKRARQMQASHFKFKRDGKIVQGAVLDIWFSSPSNQRMVSSQKPSR